MKTRVGIIGAMDIETKLLLSQVDVIDKKKFAGFTYHVCQLNTVELIITTCGIGKVNAASCTQIMIDRFEPTAIINTGVAGGMREGINVCDVVISDEVTHYDVRKKQMRVHFPYKESFMPCNTLFKSALAATQAITDGAFQCHTGKIVSGESFVDTHALKVKIKDEYSPACVDMESSAIAHVADINAVPFIIFRSISDHADANATISYEAFEEKAANHSAMIVLKMLEGLND